MGVKCLPDGRWRVVVRLKNKKLQETISGTEYDAQQKEIDFKREIRNSDTTGSGSGSVKLKTCGDVLRYYDKTRTWGNDVFNRLLSHFDYSSINYAWVKMQDLVKKMQNGKSDVTGKPFSAGTINRHINMAKGAFSAAHNTRVGAGKRLLQDNCLSGFPTLEENNKSFLVLNSDQRSEFWNALDPRLKQFYYFACRVPLRESEAFNIRREHINPFTWLIELPSPKNGIRRTLFIWEEFRPYVKEFLSSPAEYLFNRGPDESYLPLGYLSAGKIVFSLRKAWYHACDVLEGVGRKYNLHKTRQDAVMGLYAAGWSVDSIMIIGGWESREAFSHYFDRTIASLIDQKVYTVDLSWQKKLAEELTRKAA